MSESKYQSMTSSIWKWYVGENRQVHWASHYLKPNLDSSWVEGLSRIPTWDHIVGLAAEKHNSTSFKEMAAFFH